VRLEDKVCLITGAGSEIGQATVSRVLNQKSEVEPATPECILRIMEEHSFVPSIAAWPTLIIPHNAASSKTVAAGTPPSSPPNVNRALSY